MGFFDTLRADGGGGRTLPVGQPQTLGGDPWEQQMLQTLQQRYGTNQALIDQEFNYYKQKRASDEVSGRAGPGLEFPNMDAYWLHRATGRDPQDQPGGGMMGPGGMGMAGGLPMGYLSQPSGITVGMPDPGRMAASPSFQWNMSRGLDALNKSHAARGTILSGGAAKDAAEFASGLASQEYDKDFNRGLAVADFNRGTQWGDTDRIFGRYSNLAGMGLGAASNYANNVSSIYSQQANANAQNTMNQGTGWGNLAGLGIDLLGGWFANR